MTKMSYGHTHYANLSRKLGYVFRDRALLPEALTHRSYANEVPNTVSNDRLAFIGARVLELALAQPLMPLEYDVGVLAKTIARARQIGSALARDLGLPECIRVGRGQKRDQDRLLASVLEAIVGAVFMDGGYEPAASLVKRLYDNKAIVERSDLTDYKTLLQDRAHKRGLATPCYEIAVTKGPEHALEFEVAVYMDDTEIARGAGRNKKQAGQQAAQKALKNWSPNE